MDSNLDTASEDCLSCLDTNKVSVRTACKKYRKRVRVSCKLSKGMDWKKRVEGGCQDMWGHDHKIIRAKWKCVLADNHTSFKPSK